MVLSDLHSIISVPSPGEQNAPLRLFHVSLGDFLTDRSRCGDTFFLDPGMCHRNIANRTVRLLSQLRGLRSGSHLHFPYSTYWVLSIASIYSQKKSLWAAFPEHCLKATPDPEFLSNLYDCDISMCPHRPVIRISHVTQIFMEFFDPIHSSSRVPELFVWMQGQVCRIIVISSSFIDTSIETSWSQGWPLYAPSAIYWHLAWWRIMLGPHSWPSQLRNRPASHRIRNTGRLPTIFQHTPSHPASSGPKPKTWDSTRRLSSNWRHGKMGDICQISSHCFSISDCPNSFCSLVCWSKQLRWPCQISGSFPNRGYGVSVINFRILVDPF